MINMARRISFLTLILAALQCLNHLHAQSSGKSFTPKGVLGFRTQWNLDDFLMGVEGGVTLPDYKTSLLAGFDFRLGSKRVVVQDSPNLYYIYRERRYMLSLTAEQRFAVLNLGGETELEPYVRVGAGIYFGDYRGTTQKPSSQIVILPGGGLAVNFGDQFVARLGYQYLQTQTESIPIHRVLIGGSFTF
jgi:opacity protein-like surface antigen